MVAVGLLCALVCVSHGYNLKDLERRQPPPRTCADKGLCCQGQNNTCFVFGPRLDRNQESKRCYCDSNCIIMGDCCTDYHHTCSRQDCQVGDWQEWTTCDNQCGYGARKRTRKVIVYPDNGGHHCPIMKQRRACVGYDQNICDQNRLGEQAEEKAEQARILPIEFGRARTMKKYDPWKGILKNLYNKYFNEIFTRATYRGKFLITRTHYGCDDSPWANVLKVNNTVCVECQPIAMNREIGMRCLGHGVMHAKTSWKAVDVSKCHGEWVMVEGHTPDVCDYDIQYEDKLNFIFI